MRALTLLQPYASAILDGGKDVENRPQPLPSTIKPGTWIALHAGARWWKQTTLAEIRRLWPECPSPDKLPYGAILGAWQVEGGYPLADLPTPSPWAFGPFCYTVQRVVRLPEPLPCKGMQGWWRVPPLLAEKVEAAIFAQACENSPITVTPDFFMATLNQLASTGEVFRPEEMWVSPAVAEFLQTEATNQTKKGNMRCRK